MKMIWVVLLITYCFYGLQVTCAENDTALSRAEMELEDAPKSHNIQRRFLWLPFVPLLIFVYPTVATGVAVYNYHIDNGSSTAAAIINALGAASFYITLIIGAGVAIIKSVIATISSSIGILSSGMRKSNHYRNPEEALEYNMKLINDTINNNANESNPMNLLIKEKPFVEKALHFSPDGFQCNKKLCEKFGNGTYALGICTPYYCICNANAIEKKCESNFIFDLEQMECDNPLKLKICGSNL